MLHQVRVKRTDINSEESNLSSINAINSKISQQFSSSQWGYLRNKQMASENKSKNPHEKHVTEAYTKNMQRAHTHARTHTHTHTRTHTHTHTHTDTYTHSHVHHHFYTHTQTHRHTYTDTHIHALTCAPPLPHTHTHTHTSTGTQRHALTHTRTYTHSHAHHHIHTHTHTHTHTQTHAYTDTHLEVSDVRNILPELNHYYLGNTDESQGNNENYFCLFVFFKHFLFVYHEHLIKMKNGCAVATQLSVFILYNTLSWLLFCLSANIKIQCMVDWWSHQCNSKGMADLWELQ